MRFFVARSFSPLKGATPPRENSNIPLHSLNEYESYKTRGKSDFKRVLGKGAKLLNIQSEKCTFGLRDIKKICRRPCGRDCFLNVPEQTFPARLCKTRVDYTLFACE